MNEREQYQKMMTHRTSSIVCTACRTGQTAVASIPRRDALSRLRDPIGMFAHCASHAGASGLRNRKESCADLFREARLRLSTSPLRRTIVL